MVYILINNLIPIHVSLSWGGGGGGGVLGMTKNGSLSVYGCSCKYVTVIKYSILTNKGNFKL